MTTILQELLLAVGRFFMNPLLYVAFMLAVLLGYVRVKRERKFFHIRILNGWTELKSIVKVGFVASIILSIITVAGGLTVPIVFLIAVSAVTIIALIIFNYHFLSSAITFSLALASLFILYQQDKALRIFDYTIEGLAISSGAVTSIAIIVGLLLVMEGHLIAKDGAKFASPIVEKTNRGLKSIAYFSKKLWVIPVLFIVPGQAIEGITPYWPALPIGETQFSLVLFPVVLGFQQMTRRLLPIAFYPKFGQMIRLLGYVVVLGGIASYFEQIVALVTLVVAFVMRLFLSIVYKMNEKKDFYAVAPDNRGAVIAAVLPNSPAEKMGLQVGEIIKRVNSREVENERELYEALQINAAHCKLEVLDFQGEIRLAQYVVHNNDHHQIGLLIVQ